MNNNIRNMIDLLFADQKMTTENLALRDELPANAQARFEDCIAAGRSEEEAYAIVSESLEDVQALLSGKKKPAEEAVKEEAEQTAPDAEEKSVTDLEKMLGKAWTDLNRWGKNTAHDLNKATDGTLGKFYHAAVQGAEDVGKGVSETFEKLTSAAKNRTEKPAEEEKAAEPAPETPAEKPAEEDGMLTAEPEKKTVTRAEELRKKAKDLEAQASFKRITGDAETAQLWMEQAADLKKQADALDADEAAELEKMVSDAVHAAESASEAVNAAENECAEKKEDDDASPFVPAADEAAEEQPERPDEAEEPVEEDAEEPASGETSASEEFGKTLGRLAEDARKAVEQAGAMIGDACRLQEPQATVSAEEVLDPAGLRRIDIQLDADSVTVHRSEENQLKIVWTVDSDGDKPVITLENHTLTVRRITSDLFKTFFSVFNKTGGSFDLYVPKGFSPEYKITTTSGQIRLQDIDADDIAISTTSGDIRVEPDIAVRVKHINASAISGSVTISARAEEIDAKTVSGMLFISGDAEGMQGSTASGALHMEGSAAQWEAGTVSGQMDILCAEVPAAGIKLNSVSGNANVSLPENIRGFTAEITGVHGDVSNEFGTNRYGTCTLPIRMETVSGKLNITKL